MASADSKFDDLSDTGIDSVIDFTIPKKKEGNYWGIFVLKGKVTNFKFFIQGILVEVFLRVVNSLDILSGLPSI